MASFVLIIKFHDHISNQWRKLFKLRNIKLCWELYHYFKVNLFSKLTLPLTCFDEWTVFTAAGEHRSPYIEDITRLLPSRCSNYSISVLQCRNNYNHSKHSEFSFCISLIGTATNLFVRVVTFSTTVHTIHDKWYLGFLEEYFRWLNARLRNSLVVEPHRNS